MAIVIGTAGADNFTLTLDAARSFGLEDDRVAGFDGEDTIITGVGHDWIDGGSGNDVLSAGTGNDIIVGGAGNDSVGADVGNDVYYGGSGFDTLNFFAIHIIAPFAAYDINFNAVRVDLASTGVQNLGEFGLDQFFGFENLRGGNGSDALFGTGGANDLFGVGGNDTLDGRAGNDALFGEAGADVLIGGLGADDISTGGADGARDRVRFTSLLDSGITAATRDEVLSFVRGQDKIDLSLIDANPLLAGNQAFRVVSAFTSAQGEVQLLRSGADTIVRVDGDRDTAVDMDIRVVGVHLTAGDLIL